MNIATIAVVPAIILILNHIAIIASTNVQTGIWSHLLVRPVWKRADKTKLLAMVVASAMLLTQLTASTKMIVSQQEKMVVRELSETVITSAALLMISVQIRSKEPKTSSVSRTATAGSKTKTPQSSCAWTSARTGGTARRMGSARRRSGVRAQQLQSQ